MSPNSKGTPEGTAEAVARSESLKSAVFKEIRQSKVGKAKGKSRLKVVAGDQQENKTRGSVMSQCREDHKKNRMWRMQ